MFEVVPAHLPLAYVFHELSLRRAFLEIDKVPDVGYVGVRSFSCVGTRQHPPEFETIASFTSEYGFELAIVSAEVLAQKAPKV